MARRKRKSEAEALVEAPWWASVVLAVIAYVLLRWAIPSFIGSSPILKVLAGMSVGLAPWAAAVLLFIAVISFILKISSTEKDLRYIPENPPDQVGQDSAYFPASKSDSHPASQATNKPITPSEWSLALLRKIEWKGFEKLCAAYFEGLGLRAETIRCGADGGVDIKLFRGASIAPESIVQCKAWNSRPVGVKPVRELLGVMTHEKVAKGIFMTTSDYTQEARAFAQEKSLFLIDGRKLLDMISKLPQETRQQLLTLATQGDYTTPSCPKCGIKMVTRKSAGKAFWGCANFPRCKQTFNIKSE